MADQDNCKTVQLLKSTRITVFVDEALEDMIVVTYEFGVKIFKGILLDFTKRNLPCGISNLNPALAPVASAKTNVDDDTLYSVNQRFAYTDPNNTTRPKNVRVPSKYKNNKMTVRLRPRQVLCSKCKGICNENSENISKKRKLQDGMHNLPPKRSADAPVTRSVYTEQLSKKKVTKQKLEPSLIPKISRLLPHEINNALNGKFESVNGSRKKEEIRDFSENEVEQLADNSSNVGKINLRNRCINSSEDVTRKLPDNSSNTGKPNLRNRRVSSSEDTTKENIVEEKQTSTAGQNNSQLVNTRTIKISFGPQGEGTVLKIPAPIDDFKNSKELDENIVLKSESNSRAARKALKRAKKKARQKSLLAGHSPSHIVMSPRYSIGGMSPRYSPRYLVSSLEIPKRHKHKLKRKKKHKEEKDVKDAALNSTTAHKLSINLKRIYATRSKSDIIEETTSSSSDEHSEQIPNFPPPQSPLILRINAQSISSACGADGNRLLAGDVVWGKIHGFPWWPGKILSITCTENQNPQAHVSWYGSSTSSHIKCDQLSQFLDNFKIRHNKKKRGPYKEAVRQALIDAKENSTGRLRKDTIMNSPSQSILNVPPPTLASPREINVMS